MSITTTCGSNRSTRRSSSAPVGGGRHLEALLAQPAHEHAAQIGVIFG